ncbi:Aspartate--ammonia ligase [Astathelohania contejeani]|uniref:Aspartate--ammonia ligase n=1 Tax=Astathelohania contejeani TaxID=164912 RepID=A0ABQ7HYL5_9MICR|nr:Aspartate--ammonia ligase [Thelohania contejeani]
MTTEKLNLIENEKAIKLIKDTFERKLSNELFLTKVSAPLFVLSDSGLNDDLSGTERAVKFDVKSGETAVIVHSLAKWKRMALKKYGFMIGEGLYTNMIAVRRDENLSRIHSYYVDQWDWEAVISKKERTIEKLKETVRKIYHAIKETEKVIHETYSDLKPKLPEDIFFITSEDLFKLYPMLTPKEREKELARQYGAIFIIGIGNKLSSGEPHDTRAPDYDDWSLNGDILVYYKPLDIALELSSMGIRVDENSLTKQLKLANCVDRLKYPFHMELINSNLPYTIGGGIGQSRLCMFYLNKLHISEVQVSIWPKFMLDEMNQKDIFPL